MRILIAEDEGITRATLARQLRSWGHEVTAAEDGQQAWDYLAGDAEFDVVITDWEMPRMSGVELVGRFRRTTRASYTYCILLTSRSEKADVVKGIEAGADDFLSKPFDRDELRVRLLAGERIVRLERALNKQNAELREANERVRGGLRAAARVQQSMLPRGNVVTPSVRTAWRYVPTDELAGDAIGLHLIDGRHLAAYVLDVSGHGVPAALLSVSAMHALEPDPAETSLLRNQTHAGPESGVMQRPARVASELNRRFRAGENDGRYLTLVLCTLDTHNGRLCFTSAGHPPAVLLRAGRAVEVPDAGGPPVAIFDAGEYEDAVLHLSPGDRLCLYSDGIVEQFDAADATQFGKARFLHALASRAGLPPERVVAEIVDELKAWAGGAAFCDDVSIVVVDWLGPAGPAAP
jgi:sigma-B regulation protein RsbU (phosphoserine phosphatase)